MIFVPAHFASQTGQAHWEVLLRARAIENQVYIIAPNQSGVHPESGIRSYGNSLIIDPWGKILTRGPFSKEQTLTADLDFKTQDRLRKSFPVLRYIRLKTFCGS
jgi:predicted amidohydrolase